MYTLNIARAIKRVSANKIQDLVFENYYFLKKELDFLKKAVIIQ